MQKKNPPPPVFAESKQSYHEASEGQVLLRRCSQNQSLKQLIIESQKMREELDIGMMMSDGISNSRVETRSFESSYSKLSPDQVKTTLEWVESTIGNQKFSRQIRPIAALALFNAKALNKALGEDRVQAILAEMADLDRSEEEAAEITNPLPSIGIELEVPRTEAVAELSLALDKLGIYNSEEPPDLQEAHPMYSFCARPQARLLQELAKAGFVPLEEAGEEKYRINSDNLAGYKISRDIPLSLHVNLSLNFLKNPCLLEKYSRDITILSNMLTLAYASPERLAARKTVESVNSKPAEMTDKNVQIIGKWGYQIPRRIELRAVEFLDSSTYEMLFRCQQLGAALDAYSAVHEGFGQSPIDGEMKNAYSEFRRASKELQEQNDLPNNPFDSRVHIHRIIELIRTTDIKQRARSIIREAGGKINRTLEV